MTDEGDLNRSLWAACEAGDEARVEELIQAGADVKSENPSGNNGLHLSSMRGHDKIVKMFLDSGVGVNSRSFYERTPLMLAVKEGHYTTAKLLLDNKADPDLQCAGSKGQHSNDGSSVA